MPRSGLECTVCKTQEDGGPYWHWSTICSLLLINEAHCCSVLGSSDQGVEGGNPRSRTARWRPTWAGDRCMLSMVLIETSAGKECEVDCRKLSQVSQEKGYHECQRGVCAAVQREITRALTICEVWLRRSAGTRSVKL